ncbi:hypothetical protein [Kitasatospora sp. NPDC057223]|uniref:hypothetical protein n=1 Tax=Kitasatospora sp. NPDC057223 TaxID=3346055 RepID=UPI003625C75B
MKSWTDRLPQVPLPYRALPAEGAWTTQGDAAAQLGVGRPGGLAGGRPSARRRTHRHPGQLAVTRAGIDAEKRGRATASPERKAWRLPKAILGYFWSPPAGLT